MIYALPPFFIFVGWIHYEYRYHIMIPIIVMIIIYAFIQKFSFKSLGFRLDNFKSAILWQVSISVGLTLAVIIILQNGYIRNLQAPQNPWFYVMYLFLSGPVQEFVYRSVAIAEIERHQYINPFFKILIVSFNFAWLHIIYLDIIIFLAALIMGIIWTSIYYYKRNFWAVSIAHAITGFLAIWYGLI